MKGGWFCSPEEYESMGFTLGLPPGLYLEQTEEINELVEKIKPINGMVMPSFYLNQSFGHKENRNIVLISNVPLDVTQDDIIKELNKTLFQAKIFPQTIDSDSDSKSFIISCQIVRTHFVAYVKMISSYITEKAVNLGQLRINDYVLPISFPDFIMKDSSALDKIYSTVHENELCVVIEIDYYKVDPNIRNEIQLPSEEAIARFFGENYAINKIFRPADSNFILLYLTNKHDVDMIIINHDNCIIDSIPVTVHRSKRDLNECELFIDPKMKEKVKRETGKSQYLTVLSPYMNQCDSVPSIADIFDPSMSLNAVIRKETEELQPATGKYLLIFNIVKFNVFNEQTLFESTKRNIFLECNKFGKVISTTLGSFFKNQLLCDNAVACVTFENAEDAKAAQIGISGRRYQGRLAITQIVDEPPDFAQK